MRRTLLPILFALLFACGNLWAGGLFPGTGGGGGAADEITYDNSTSGLSATNVKDALDEVTTMAGTGGLASVDDLPGDTVNDTKIDVGLLPTGTTSSTVSLGNHTHASLYQPLDTDLTTWAGVTPSANGQALVSAANYAAMRGLLDLEAGTDFNAYSATLNTLSGLTLTGNSKYIGTNSSGEAGVYDLPSGAGMVYPGAGVPNSTGSAWGTSYTVGTSANNLVQLNGSAALPAVSGANLTSVNAATLGGATFAAPGAIGGTTPAAGTFTTLSAGASGFGVDADGDVTAKSLTITKVSGTAGTLRAYEANSTDTNTVGWMGPASISASWDYQFSSTQPVANSIMLFGAPASNVSAQTWITLDDTGTNGDTAKIWSADKCYDQLALKANASHSHSGSDITSGTVSASYLPSVSGTTAGIVPTTSGVTDGYVLTKQSNGSAAWAAQTGGSGMTWPSSAGIAVYSGSSSWGTSLTAPSGTIVGTSDTQTLTNKTLSTGTVIPVTIGIACSDESTALTTGTAKATFRMPHAMTLTAVRASVGTAPTGSTIIVDINEGGSTIMTTNKLSIDASEKTSTTAATAASLTDTSLADDAEITIDIDQIGSSTAGAGLKVWLIGTRKL